jgi:hypothetical protein
LMLGDCTDPRRGPALAVRGARIRPTGVRRGRAVLGLLWCAAAVLCVSAAPAWSLTEHVPAGSFGEAGSGEGQFSTPAGVAVHSSTSLTDATAGDVYVVDRGDGRVERFDAAGKLLSQFDGGATPAGSFSEPSGIAVDNSTDPLDPSVGDVYVLDFGHNVIDKFSATGAYLGQITEGAGEAPFGFEELKGIAVDTAGEVWLYRANKEIDNYDDSTGNALIGSRESPFGAGEGFAVDSEDNLYVRRGEPFVAKLSAAGESLINPIGGEEPSAVTTALAVDPSDDALYLYSPEVKAISVFVTNEQSATQPRIGKHRDRR